MSPPSACRAVANDVGLETVTGLSDSGGRFMLLGVPPGEYVLQHANRIPRQGAATGKAVVLGFAADHRRTRGHHAISPSNCGRHCASQDGSSSVAVVTRKRHHRRGLLESHSKRRLASRASSSPKSIATSSPSPPSRPAAATSRDRSRPADGSCTSVTLDGKDVTDRVLDLQSDATSFVVTYTDRASKVTGTVTDARGAPSATAVVLAFPVDQQRWSGYGASPRTLKSANTTASGVYTFAHLPPGDYYLIAVENADADGWQDPSRLEALASSRDAAVSCGRRCAQDTGPSRQEHPVIGRSLVVLAVAIAAGTAATGQQPPPRDNAAPSFAVRRRSPAPCWRLTRRSDRRAASASR